MGSSNARAEFEIALSDKTSAGVASSVDGLKKAEASMKGLNKEYAETKNAISNLQKGQFVDIETHKKLEARKKALGERMAGLQVLISKQKIGMSDEAKAAYQAAGGADKFSRGLKSGEDGLKKSASGLGALSTGFLATAAGAVVLTGAIVGAVYATYRLAKSFTELAATSADAYRSELLHFSAITKIRNVWGITGGSANVMRDAVDKVSDSVALSREQLGGYAEQLQVMGFRGANLTQTLEGMAILAQTQGEKYGQAFAQMASQTVYFGGSVKTMLNDVKAQLGKNLVAQMLSLPNLLALTKKRISALFQGINIDPLLKALSRLSQMLSLNSATGKALQQIFSTLFNAFFGQAGKAADTLQNWVENVVIKAQELTIGVLRAIKSGGGIGPAIGKWFDGALEVLEPKMYALLTKLAETAGKAAIPIGGAILRGIVHGLASGAEAALTPHFEAKLKSDLESSGVNASKGLATGIDKGMPWVIQAMRRLGTGAFGQFNQDLEIKSPSRKMFRSGLFVAQGTGLGIRAGLPYVHAAVREMSSVAIGDTLAANTNGGPALSASNVRPRGGVTIETLNVYVTSADPHGIAAAVKLELERELEGALIEMGAA